MLRRGGGPPPPRDMLQAMTDVISHRGPDAQGSFHDDQISLGHRRLKIIDLSEFGAQPMTSDDGRFTLVYNGEIYNYVELMADLKSAGAIFRSTCDTEVILHLFAREGIACLDRLNGMFALAIWDAHDRVLWLARDRLGIKPLYYLITDRCCVFASEIKGILASGLVDARPDPQAMFQYVSHMYTTGEATFFDGISRLLPGQWISVKPDSVERRWYWDIPVGQRDEFRPKKVASRLRDLLDDATSIRLRSDVPVGAYLSGGMDSSSIVALASKKLENLHTFSIAFDEGPAFDEREHLRLVQKQCGTVHHEITPTPEDFAQALGQTVFWMDEPTVASPTISQYFLSKLARDNVTVALGGQGGDELFGGYYRFFPQYLKHFARRTLQRDVGPGELLKTLGNFIHHLSIVGPGQMSVKMRKHSVMRSLMTPDFAASAYHDQRAFMMDRVEIDDPFERMLYWEVKNYLPGLLHAEDRMSMAVSLESRVPILDHRIVEMAARMPPEQKMRNLVTKSILRQAMKDDLPAPITRRMDKRGTPSPMPIWFRGPLAPLVREILDRPEADGRGVFDPTAAKRIVDDHLTGRKDYGEQVWMLLSVELWHMTFIDQSVADSLGPLTLT